MKSIKVKTPAKINLTLKVEKPQEDGFHPIESIMQAISLYDFLTIKTKIGATKITLSGNSNDIPYDEKNIVHKAILKYIEASKTELDVQVYIDKNIPVSAGLAGGSANAAGVIYGLNKIYNFLNYEQIFMLLKELGSDLNFCYLGSRRLCTGKGDEMQQLEFKDFNLSLIKPKNLGISAGFAYKKFDELKEKSNLDNDLEFALLPYYDELRFLHSKGFKMSGSGPTYYSLNSEIENMGDKYLIINNLKAVDHGVIESEF